MLTRAAALAALACALLWTGAAFAPAQENAAAPEASQAEPVPLEGPIGAAALVPVSPQILDPSLQLGLLNAPALAPLPSAAVPASAPKAANAALPAPASLPAPAAVTPVAVTPAKAGVQTPAEAARKPGALRSLAQAARQISRPGASKGGALRALLDGENGDARDAAVAAYAAAPAPSRLSRWARSRFYAWRLSRFKDEDLSTALFYADKMPTPAAKKMIAGMAKRLLRRHGVDYRETDKNRLVITPGGGSRLNRFAAAVQRQFSADVEFWADQLIDSKAGAYHGSFRETAAYEGGMLGLPAASVVSGRPFSSDDAMASHEMVHMATRKRGFADSSDPIHGWLMNSPALKDDPGYAKYFSLDELDAYDLTQRLLVAKARTAYERRARDLAAPDPVELLEQAEFYCGRLRALLAAAPEADKELLALAGSLRAGKGRGDRFGGAARLSIHAPGGMITLKRTGWIKVSFDPFTTGLKYGFAARGLSAESSDQDIAAALERQAEGLDDIAANKSYALQRVTKRLESLLRLLRARRAPSPRAVRRAFAELISAEHFNPATESQRKSWARRAKKR
ncbi:MAG TPA: hypothetical protein VNH15_04485 [Elusimicrobiota bacterium]|nr:hypothetical protein [Elusimicrobiota bacterium]